MKKIIIASGGTAGHINAALAVGDAFQNNGDEVIYVTGKRKLDYKLLPTNKTIHLDTVPIRYKNPLKIIKNIIINFRVFIGLLNHFKKLKPDYAVGAGGYVCGPTLLACKFLGIKVFIIEQNAVMGLTNRILSIFSNKIFTHFDNTLKVPLFKKNKIIVSGNPVRSSIVNKPRVGFGSELNLFVFGGSLGATQINEIIKELLKSDIEKKLKIVHQVGHGNLFKYPENENIHYAQYEYIDDIGEYYDWCDIIISRAGASTISELRIIKKPSILIPYPSATDNHQYFNALELQNENLFPVLVIDHRKSNVDILIAILDFIGNLKNDNKKYSVPNIIIDPVKIIMDEILHD